MPLPNFPIRTRLIPYDDLGIQEVSPNLLSLQNDVDIVLAALMAMSEHGTQMLQVDVNGSLLVNSSKSTTFNQAGGFQHVGTYNISDVDNIITGLDFGDSSYVVLVTIVSGIVTPQTTVTPVFGFVGPQDSQIDLEQFTEFTTNNVDYDTIGQYTNQRFLTNNMYIRFDTIDVGTSFIYDIYAVKM